MNRIKAIGLAAALAAVFFIHNGCSRGTEPVARNIIAQINDQFILRDEFIFFLEANYAAILEEKDEPLLSTILDDYLEQRLLVSALAGRNRHPSQEEISDFLKLSGMEEPLKSYDLQQKRMLALNTSLILAEDKFKKMVAENLRPIPEEQLQRYYEQNINEFLKGEALCFIRFSSPYEDLLKDARYWLVSRRRDVDFIRERYQDIQIEEDCFAASDIPDTFLKPLKGLKVNRVSDIVDMQLGQVVIYSMFRLTQRIPPRKQSFEEVKDLIRHNLETRMLQAELKRRRSEMLQRARITVYPEHILVFNYTGRFPVSHGEEE